MEGGGQLPDPAGTHPQPHQVREPAGAETVRLQPARELGSERQAAWPRGPLEPTGGSIVCGWGKPADQPTLTLPRGYAPKPP